MSDERIEDAGTSLGAFYPQNAAVAVVEDTRAAEHLVSTLQESGYVTMGAEVWRPGQVIAGLRELRESRNTMEKVGAFLSDEDLWQQQYHEFAEQGNAIVVVPAETADDARRIAEIVDHEPVRLLRHYGDAVVTDVLPEPDEAEPAR